MSDPPVPMPWSGGGHQAQDGAAWLVPAPLRASYLCPEPRHWAAMRRHFAHIAPRSHTGREGAACPSPLTSQWAGWALQRAPLSAPHAPAVPGAGVWRAGLSPLSPSPAPPGRARSPTAPCAPHPAPRPETKLRLCGELCARPGSGVKGMGLAGLPGVRGEENPLFCSPCNCSPCSAPLACLKGTDRPPPSRCFRSERDTHK